MSKKTIFHIEGTGESVDVHISGDELGLVITAVLVSDPSLIPMLEKQIRIAKQMIALSTSGEIDITGMMKVIHKNETKQ